LAKPNYQGLVHVHKSNIPWVFLHLRQRHHLLTQKVNQTHHPPTTRGASTGNPARCRSTCTGRWGARVQRINIPHCEEKNRTNVPFFDYAWSQCGGARQVNSRIGARDTYFGCGHAGEMHGGFGGRRAVLLLASNPLPFRTNVSDGLRDLVVSFLRHTQRL